MKTGSPFTLKATGSKKARAAEPMEFLEEVQAALFQRLDQAFPEFGWVRDKRGWVARDEKFTKDNFGARPDRVVCHEKFGFYVHGGSPMPWMSYFNGGSPPRGAMFFEVLKELAALAGVDASVLDRELTAEEEKRHEEESRRRTLFEVFLEHAQEDLVGTAGTPGRAYLVDKRGFKEDGLVKLGFGFFTKKADVLAGLKKAGFTDNDIDASGLVADGRWEGRIVSPCRDWRGQIQGFWARDITGQAEEGAKYLKNRGFTEKSVVAYGLDEALRHEAGRKKLIIVEGLLDVLMFRANGFMNVAALGSAGRSLSAERWDALAKMGVQAVTLVMDNDRKPDGRWEGRDGTLAAVDHLKDAKHAPEVWVLDPAELGAAKDPDELIRSKGLQAFTDLLDRRVRGNVFRGLALLEEVNEGSPSHEKRETFDRVLDFVAGLRGPQASLDLEDIIKAASEALGYSEDALAVAAHAHKERKTREDVKRSLRALLRDAGEGAKKDPVAAVAKLSGELATLQAKSSDKPICPSVNAIIQEIRQTPKALTAGWEGLKALDVGFYPGELAYLAGRTGHGKTTFFTNLLYNFMTIDKTAGVVLFYSHEEPIRSIFLRLMALSIAHELTSSCSHDEYWSVKALQAYLKGDEGTFAGTDLVDEAVKRVEAFWGSRCNVVWRPDWTVEDISAHALAEAQDRKVAAVLVDYLQRIPPSKELGKGRRRDEEVSHIGRRLKVLAETLKAPVLAGAQINRDAVKGAKEIPKDKDFTDSTVQAALKGRRPKLHQLREGGSEQEADLVLGFMSYFADFEDETGKATLPDVTKLEIGTLKNRYGAPGRWASLAFIGKSGLLRDPLSNEL
jgi:DNA primase